MRELRVSTANFNTPADNDCFIPEDDPIYALMGQGFMGTLSTAAVDQAYAAKKRQDISDQHFQLREEAKKQGIRPGTPAWFALTQGK